MPVDTPSYEMHGLRSITGIINYDPGRSRNEPIYVTMHLYIIYVTTQQRLKCPFYIDLNSDVPKSYPRKIYNFLFFQFGNVFCTNKEKVS